MKDCQLETGSAEGSPRAAGSHGDAPGDGGGGDGAGQRVVLGSRAIQSSPTSSIASTARAPPA
jgi:hypothetical protein